MAESTDSCVVTEVSQRCTAAAAQLKQAGRYHMLDTDGSNGHNGHEGGGEVAAVEGGVGQGLFHGAFPCAILYVTRSVSVISSIVGWRRAGPVSWRASLRPLAPWCFAPPAPAVPAAASA